MYTVTKLVVALVTLVGYGVFIKWTFGFSAQDPKSLLGMVMLIGLTQYKDKFEKKIVSTYEPSKLHFARAMLLPLVYITFTFMFVLQDGSLSAFILATLY